MINICHMALIHNSMSYLKVIEEVNVHSYQDCRQQRQNAEPNRELEAIWRSVLWKEFDQPNRAVLNGDQSDTGVHELSYANGSPHLHE